MEPLTITIHLQSEDIPAVVMVGSADYPKSPRKWRVVRPGAYVALYAAMLVILLLLRLFTQVFNGPFFSVIWFVMVAVVAVVLLLLIAYYTYWRKTSRRILNNSAPWTLTVDESGIRDTKQDGSQELFFTWDQIILAKIAPPIYSLISSNHIVIHVPRRDLGDKAEQFEGYLQTYLADRGTPVYRYLTQKR